LPLGLGPQHVGLHPGLLEDPAALGIGGAELGLGFSPDADGLGTSFFLHLLRRLRRCLQHLADLLGKLPVAHLP
jgi:hypothetical protein